MPKILKLKESFRVKIQHLGILGRPFNAKAFKRTIYLLINVSYRIENQSYRSETKDEKRG